MLGRLTLPQQVGVFRYPLLALTNSATSPNTIANTLLGIPMPNL